MPQRVTTARHALDRLGDAAASAGRPMTFMEVCGTHTMSAARCGLHSVMPATVTLLSGPGCPVCVTAQGDIDLIIEAAFVPGVTLCTYGDMLRVPGRRGSLERARSRGADVRIVYSAMDAVKMAQQLPGRQIVFAAVGFETTAPASAVSVTHARELGLTNFAALVSHKRVIPAMTGLLESGSVHVDGFLCPGHVSVIIGSEPYRPIVDMYGIPCVITGFEESHMALGLACLAEQVRDGAAELVNLYPEAVSSGGNQVAQQLMHQVFEPADMRWRGLGVIPRSGLALNQEHREFDAQLRLGLSAPEDREPRGCRCGDVITGGCVPPDCELFESVCTPILPIGPCMVSSEGSCQAWFKYKRLHVAPIAQMTPTEVTS